MLRLDRAASVQFDGERGITAEVLRVLRRSVFRDWLWLRVRVLDPPARPGEAVRDVFIRRAGVSDASGSPDDG